MATEYLDKAGLQKLVQLIQSMPDDATLEFVDGKLQVKSPLPVINGGTGAINGADALDNLGVKDFIIAEGTSGDWYYKKYNSGIAVCVAKYEQTKKVETQWGTLYTTTQFGETDFPFQFVERPQVYITAYNLTSDQDTWVVQDDIPTATNSGRFFLARASSAVHDVLNFEIMIKAVGRWK